MFSSSTAMKLGRRFHFAVAETPLNHIWQSSCIHRVVRITSGVFPPRSLRSLWRRLLHLCGLLCEKACSTPSTVNRDTKEPPPEEAKRMRRKSSGGAAVDWGGGQGYLLDEGTSAGSSAASEEEKFRRGAQKGLPFPDSPGYLKYTNEFGYLVKCLCSFCCVNEDSG